jgi:hypothetical protein
MLVGRPVERAIIDELLRDAERGVAAAVLFAGPPGISNWVRPGGRGEAPASPRRQRGRSRS